MKNVLIFCLSVLLVSSCSQRRSVSEETKEFEFVVVDSLVTDILENIRILDYHHEKEIYLAVKQISLDGHYYLLNKKGEIIAENFLSEGPDAFGMILVRAGFVGDEILFVSEGTSYIYDLEFKQLRRYAFEQGIRARLIHFTLDNLSTYSLSEGSISAVMNLNDGFLQQYPIDYFDTLNLVHLMNTQTGEVSKGGKLIPNSKFTSGTFYPFLDKPVFFSDSRSSYISTILYGDTLLYQLDPSKNFEIANTIALPRISPSQIKEVPMDQATLATVREFRADNVRFGGMFDQLIGFGNEVLVGYLTGLRQDLFVDNPSPEQSEALAASQKRFYFLIKDGKKIGQPVLWDKAGSLVLNVGSNRYLQYADQADLHEAEKDYQCYYIYALQEKVEDVD